MSKFYKLKEWVTVPDAAKRLSNVFEEEISEADVLQLVLSSKLQLSIYFPNETYAQPWVEISFGAHWLIIEHDTLVSGEANPSFDGEEPIEKTESNYKGEPFTVRYRRTRKDTMAHMERGDVVKIKGIWNLPMIHDEYQIISERHGSLIGSLPIDTISSHFKKNYEGMVCISNDKGEIFEVITNYEYYRDNPYSLEDLVDYDELVKNGIEHVSVGKFPRDNFFVVRTNVLTEFEQQFMAGSTVIDALPETTSRREQQIEIILVVIAALNFEPLKIPDGGKAEIRKACLNCSRLFTDASFDHAWKKGLDDGLFRLKNHKKYSPKK